MNQCSFLPSPSTIIHNITPSLIATLLPPSLFFSFIVSLIPLIINTHLDILSLNLFFAFCFFLCWLCFCFVSLPSYRITILSLLVSLFPFLCPLFTSHLSPSTLPLSHLSPTLASFHTLSSTLSILVLINVHPVFICSSQATHTHVLALCPSLPPSLSLKKEKEETK
ncbi:hypothetical protein K457DRAFT_1237100 [Linnemannia elongata AG-77]|uniref:Uncharacterized protein n=1 Tax=Linnemannia elongata AG-77 TaxID=1314771 RepID=A0A197K3G1_9FUNG|nr:hypothetical protein K457DRAFT_1237100 [Linnemannia elongata AG-77]